MRSGAWVPGSGDQLSSPACPPRAGSDSGCIPVPAVSQPNVQDRQGDMASQGAQTEEIPCRALTGQAAESMSMKKKLEMTQL